MAAGKHFAQIFETFVSNPKLKGSFAEDVWKGFQLVEAHNKLHLRDNQLLLRLKVLPSYCNYMGSIHGGCLTTILDCATTLAVLKMDKHLRKSVSAELNFSFQNPASDQEHLLIQAECSKVGKNLAFTSADIYVEETMKLVGRGQHVKAMLSQPYDT